MLHSRCRRQCSPLIVPHGLPRFDRDRGSRGAAHHATAPTSARAGPGTSGKPRPAPEHHFCAVGARVIARAPTAVHRFSMLSCGPFSMVLTLNASGRIIATTATIATIAMTPRSVQLIPGGLALLAAVVTGGFRFGITPPSGNSCREDRPVLPVPVGYHPGRRTGVPADERTVTAQHHSRVRSLARSGRGWCGVWREGSSPKISNTRGTKKRSTGLSGIWLK